MLDRACLPAREILGIIEPLVLIPAQYSAGTRGPIRLPPHGASWIQMIHIYYNNGRVRQGVVLAFGDRVVRVAVKGSDDISEFRLVNQVWVSEDCEVVRLDFAESTAPVESGASGLLETLFRFERLPLPIQRVM